MTFSELTATHRIASVDLPRAVPAYPEKAIESKQRVPAPSPVSVRLMDTLHFHRIYVAAKRCLAAMELRVLEGKDVGASLDFARFLTGSGICSLLRDNPEPNERLRELQPYDGNELFDAAERLRLLCCQYYAGRTSKSEGTPKNLPGSVLEHIVFELQSIKSQLQPVNQPKQVQESVIQLPPG